MLELSSFSALLITFIITNVLLVCLTAVSHTLKNERNIVIARISIGIAFGILSAIILDTPISLRMPIISIVLHLLQITTLFAGFFYCVYKGTDEMNGGSGLEFIRTIIVVCLIHS